MKLFFCRLSTIFLICIFFNCVSHSFTYDVSVVGFLKRADGIGQHAIEMLDMLKDELSINWIPSRSHIPNFDTIPDDLYPEIQSIVDTPQPETGASILFVDILADKLFNFYKACPKGAALKFAFSVFETDGIPQKWVKILNKEFDAVIVPDPFLQETYKKAGVTKPIFVIPLPLNLEPFLEQEPHTCCKKPFIFGNLAAGLDRKNHALLIKAFVEAFKGNPDIELVLNMRFCDPDIFTQVNNLITSSGVSTIRWTQQPLTFTEYIELFKHIDCYVNFSYGEGFGISHREALALGIPLITSENSSQHTVVKAGYARGVKPGEPIPAYIDVINQPCGNYRATDFFDAVQAMRDVYSRYEYYQAKALEGREWAKLYLKKNLCPLYKSLLKPLNITLGHTNEVGDDYVITNNKKFYEKCRAYQVAIRQ